jgi:hypothetical protein
MYDHGPQKTIRTVIARAGTSRGLFLHEADLPPAGRERDALLVRLLGSPDKIQIDGLGGSRPITSKIAIISQSARPDADVDYTFAQVHPARGTISYDGNCGNISSGVGPFAVDERLVPLAPDVTRVRIFNTNTAKTLVADVPMRGSYAAVDGDYVVPGVPGTGAEIKMDWRWTVGAKTGRLLPTGSPVEEIKLATGRVIEASLVDAGNPCVWVRGGDFGLDGTETQDQVNGDPALLSALEDVRAEAAARFGLAASREQFLLEPHPLPMIGMVSRPVGYQTINGAAVTAAEMDVRLHLIFLGILHESVAGTGSVSIAAASRVPGTIVHEVADNTDSGTLRLGHPSGVTTNPVRARAADGDPGVEFDELGFSRTARRLMEGRAFYPATLTQG